MTDEMRLRVGPRSLTEKDEKGKTPSPQWHSAIIELKPSFADELHRDKLVRLSAVVARAGWLRPFSGCINSPKKQ